MHGQHKGTIILIAVKCLPKIEKLQCAFFGHSQLFPSYGTVVFHMIVLTHLHPFFAKVAPFSLLDRTSHHLPKMLKMSRSNHNFNTHVHVYCIHIQSIGYLDIQVTEDFH